MLKVPLGFPHNVLCDEFLIESEKPWNKGHWGYNTEKLHLVMLKMKKKNKKKQTSSLILNQMMLTYIKTNQKIDIVRTVCCKYL